MKYLIFLSFTIALVSCVYTTNVSPSEDIEIKENKTMDFNFNSQKIKLSIIDVQDSRCPVDVNCIRAGEVIVQFDLVINNQSFSDNKLCIQCEAPMDIPSEIQIEGNTISLKEVNPFPSSNNGNDAKTVVFQMR